jgi:ATP-dependent DNA helicase RecQ
MTTMRHWGKSGAKSMSESNSADLTAAEDKLHAVFGFRGFRPGQAEIVSAVLEGRDVLAVIPTGGGKSLCYQLPALLRDGLTVVVSPLIALMRNQVAQLQAYGVAAGSFNSSNEPGEARDTYRRLMSGELRILYLAPERLAVPETRELLVRNGVSLLAIDEAHCVSQWGHDFRPEYMAIGEAAAALGEVQRIALTATADAGTRAEIQAKLFNRKPAIFVHGFDRPNLRLAMRPKNEVRRQLTTFIEAHRGESGIVYCASRKQTEDLANFLSGKGYKALAYHAGMEGADRSRNQDAFLQEDGLIMAATVAFGMGIDKPDVRFVAHANLPKSIEAYYQEIGRAGRDGLPAETLTLYGLDDIRLRRVQIEGSEAPEEQKRIEKQRLNALIALCEAPRCRRQTLLAYFGETTEPCGNCDLCLEGVEMIDGTIEAQKALSAIMRTRERFGAEYLIDILRGEATDRVTKFGHDRLPTFGVGKDRSQAEWRSIFRQLYAAGVMTFDIAGHGSWTITERGRRVLKGAEKVPLRRETLKAASSSSRGSGKPSAAASTPLKELGPADKALFDALRAVRLERAKEARVAAFVILPDRSLLDMVHLKPATRDQMRMVHGIGEAKLEKYGDVFLQAIRRHLEAQGASGA